MVYTNVSDVAAELGGVSITTATTPTITQVNVWIQEASDEIDEVTGQVWTSKTVSSDDYEYHDYDGSGIVRLNNRPIISIDSAEYETEGLAATSTSWSTLSEGRTDTDDYILYKKEGVIKIHSTSDVRKLCAGYQNLRFTYTYGRIVTPSKIKRLCTLLVAKRYILSVANKSASTEGGAVSVGSISVSDPNNYVYNHLSRINEEIDRLYRDVVPKLKTYVYYNRMYE